MPRSDHLYETENVENTKRKTPQTLLNVTVRTKQIKHKKQNK